MPLKGPENCMGFIYLWYDRRRKMFYLGSHFYGKKNYICGSLRMKRAYHKRQEDFKRRILFKLKKGTKEELQRIEKQWLMLIKESELGTRYYNLKREATGGHGGTNKGFRHSLEAKTKMSLARKGKPLDPEHHAKIIQAHIGAKRSEESRLRMSEAQRNRKPPSLETRMKMANSRRGRKHSPEVRAKIAEANRRRALKKHAEG